MFELPFQGGSTHTSTNDFVGFGDYDQRGSAKWNEYGENLWGLAVDRDYLSAHFCNDEKKKHHLLVFG